MNRSSPGHIARFFFQTYPDRARRIKVVLVVPCVAGHWVWKLFGYPWDVSIELGINFSSLDKVLAYKTIERFDETVA
jgi:hypothetical protein